MGGGSSKPTAAPVQVETQVQAMAQSLIQSLQARQVALEAQSDSLDAFQVDQGQNYKTGLANLQNQLNIFNQGCSEMSNVLETQFNDFVQQILETADPVQIECLRAYYTLQSVLLYYEIWAYFVAAAAANHPNLLTDPNDAFFRPDARLAPLFEQFAQKSNDPSWLRNNVFIGNSTFQRALDRMLNSYAVDSLWAANQNTKRKALIQGFSQTLQVKPAQNCQDALYKAANTCGPFGKTGQAFQLPISTEGPYQANWDLVFPAPMLN